MAILHMMDEEKNTSNESNCISNSNLILHGQEVTRQELLVLWLRKHGISFCELGRRLGISDVAVKRICRGDTAPVNRVAALMAEGIPAELLPKPLNRVRGRKPREISENFMGEREEI